MNEHIDDTTAVDQFLKNIGFRIQYFRKSTDLSQEELAERTDLSPSTIAHIEASAPYTLSLKTLFKIANALSVEPYKLLYFE